MKYLLFVLLITGCDALPWPTTVSVDSEHKEEIESFLYELNNYGYTIIDNTKKDNYSVTIISFGLEEPTLGTAMPSNKGCSIILSDVLFTKAHRSKLKTTVWHEMGHCAGLMHDSKQGRIMYKYASNWEEYSSSEVSRFLSDIMLNVNWSK